MSWLLFGQIVILLVLYALIWNFVKCIHTTYCAKCKGGK